MKGGKDRRKQMLLLFLDLPGSEYLVSEDSQRQVFDRFGRQSGFDPIRPGPCFPGCRCSSIALFPTCGHSLPPLPFNLHVPLLMQSGYYVPRPAPPPFAAAPGFLLLSCCSCTQRFPKPHRLQMPVSLLASPPTSPTSHPRPSALLRDIFVTPIYSRSEEH